MGAMTVMDKRGRITLGKKIEKKYGKRFFIVPATDEIILMPVAKKDPVERLAEYGRRYGLNKFSVKQLLKMAEEEAEKEAFSNLH